MYSVNETHDPNLTSWVESANGHTQFSIQNLPFAIFKQVDSQQTFRGGVAIGNKVLDLAKVADLKLFADKAQIALEAGAQATLNALMALGSEYHSALRLALSRALRVGAKQQAQLQACLVDDDKVEFTLPCQIGDYTDFYTSIYHATAVGKLFRPDNPLLPNYKWIPIGYHGRSSSIDVSGQTFPRPVGQTKAPDQSEPTFGPCKRLDYELEMGIFIGKGTQLGERVSLQNAEQCIFGISLLNDWSARDIQAWEYQPLGPFLAKNFASTISPWIVTLEALAPFRAPLIRPDTDPQPLAYLSSQDNAESGSLDIELECLLHTQQMKEQREGAHRLSVSNFKYSYWTPAQLVTHHSVNGCPLQAGDLMGSGTQSGPDISEAGSLLELTQGGKVAIDLPNGQKRTFLEDGDTIIMRAHCQREGAATIGFGEVTGTVTETLL